jgi:hypothetical protein
MPAPIALAVEIKVVPASSNLGLGGQQFPLSAAEMTRIRGAARPARLPWFRGFCGSTQGQLPRQRLHRGQKIQVGIGHAGQIVTVEEADTTFRVYLGDQLLTEVVRTTIRSIARFKVRQPEPPRRSSTTFTATEMV